MQTYFRYVIYVFKTHAANCHNPGCLHLNWIIIIWYDYNDWIKLKVMRKRVLWLNVVKTNFVWKMEFCPLQIWDGFQVCLKYWTPWEKTCKVNLRMWPKHRWRHSKTLIYNQMCKLRRPRWLANEFSLFLLMR